MYYFDYSRSDLDTFLSFLTPARRHYLFGFLTFTSDSQREYRPPHLNVDVLRNEMHKAGLIQRLGLQTGDELVRW
jgi:hypothetical protein